MTVRNLTKQLLEGAQVASAPCFLGWDFCLSYDQVRGALRTRAAALRAGGVRPGARVVLALPDSPELAILFHACLAVGALPVAANPRLDAASNAFLHDDLDPRLCLVEPAAGARWPAGTRLQEIAPGDHRGWLARAGDISDGDWGGFAAVDPMAPALIQYTSGSTGAPKGVVLSAHAVLAACEIFARGALGLGPDDRIFSAPKSFFGFGQGNSLFFGPFSGAATILDAAWPAPAGIAAILQELRPTVFFAVPTIYRALLEEGLGPDAVALRLCFSAGAPLSPDLAERWRARMGGTLFDGIGATELTHVFATTCPEGGAPGSLGRELPGLELRILDAGGAPCPEGEVGVLHVRGPITASGYWRRPEGQAGKFRDGWYRTGDLFSRDGAGELHFHGREDDRFKVKGRWVSPVEIEKAISAHCPEIGDSFVVPQRESTGETVPALIVLHPPGADTLARIRSALRTRVERHKLPSAIHHLAQLPLNRNGKPDRASMAHLLAERNTHTEIA